MRTDLAKRNAMLNPLVSFCVKSYNQKQYLVEALKGAFSQTYRPLEIVISDDCSTDGSWEYIQVAVAEFIRVHNDVSVVTNRNPMNLGNLGNWQKCCELSHGELLVKADGDDVSLPGRAERIVQNWIDDGRRASVISSAYICIDKEGREVGGGVPGAIPGVLGAVQAYRRDCWDVFSDCPVADLATGDDNVFSLRALILGTELLIGEQLVKYRIGTGVSSLRRYDRKVAMRGSLYAQVGRRQVLNDLDYVFSKGRVSVELYREMKPRLQSYVDLADAYVKMIDGKSVRDRFLGWTVACTGGWLNWRRYYAAINLLPKRVGDSVYSVIIRCKWFFGGVLNKLRKRK